MVQVEGSAQLKVDIYGGQDPAEMPIYTYAAAARYLGVPSSTVSWWVKGREAGGYEPVLRVAHHKGLSFLDLVELDALKSLRRVHGVQLASIRQALHYAEKRLQIERLLLRSDLMTDGAEVFLDHLGEIVNLTRGGQLMLRAVLEMFLKRVERDERFRPSVLFPDFRGVDANPGYRPVSINPRVAFGRPTMTGTGVHTAVVAERINAGESVDELAEDYAVTPDLIVSAVSYELAA